MRAADIWTAYRASFLDARDGDSGSLIRRRGPQSGPIPRVSLCGFVRKAPDLGAQSPQPFALAAKVKWTLHAFSQQQTLDTRE
eukprot:CAMPEP_0119310634 /NCGR_PEP_ID=MMETSP1333-20130426/19684_1 /TAXON_ID=418940 /ORGANISM="Scyphosphaera apsteinii, Strain RCC1455" /LENGTH=82 /DNA_ID=CAMNT_0007314851 /DNA_START=212 /DNA_END=460 /DNA_ORIENTATION=+